MAVKTRNDGSSLSKSDKQTLQDAVKGEVIFKGEVTPERYDEVIKRWNESFIEQANIVAIVESETDIAASIKFATKHGLDVAVAGGRHSYHGASSTTGLVIDLRKINSVEVDKAAKTVTAGGGCIARDLEVPAEAEGLQVVFGAVNETGIAGLTLGGGVGWLSGQYGLSLDTLLSARVALASGEIVVASEQENEDLFWGIRGAGGNFGIVTEFVFQAHEQGPCFFEIVVFSMDKLNDCLSIVENLRTEAVEPAGGKLQLMLAMMAPPGIPHCPAFMIFYDGPEEEARRLTAPIYDIGPLTKMGGMMPYTEVTSLFDKFKMDGFDRWASSNAHLDYPLNTAIVGAAMQDFLTAVEKHAPDFNHSVFMLDFRDYRKVASVPSSATAYANRFNAPFIAADFRWGKPELDQIARDEAKNITNRVKESIKEHRATAKVQADGQRDFESFYGNIASGHEKIESLYGANLPRLRGLKRKFDPEGLWNKWYPITPS